MKKNHLALRDQTKSLDLIGVCLGVDVQPPIPKKNPWSWGNNKNYPNTDGSHGQDALDGAKML